MRTTRRLAPTGAGAAYIATCRRVLAQIEEADRVLKGEYSEPRGELTVTAALVFGRLQVLPVVNAFLSRLSKITVRLLLSDRIVDIIEDHVDVAVRIARLPDNGLIATQLGLITRVVCAFRLSWPSEAYPRTLQPCPPPVHDFHRPRVQSNLVVRHGGSEGHTVGSGAEPPARKHGGGSPRRCGGWCRADPGAVVRRRTPSPR